MEEGFVWKTRDAAEELLRERQQMMVAEQLDGTTTSATTTNTEQQSRILHRASLMPIRNAFEPDGLMNRLAHQQRIVVQKAFQAAASCVLQALLSPPAAPAAPHESRIAPPLASPPDDDNDDNLPGVLSDWKRLEECRRISLDRSHNNKEYSRRKKLDAATAAAASSMDLDDDVASHSNNIDDLPVPPVPVSSASASTTTTATLNGPTPNDAAAATTVAAAATSSSSLSATAPEASSSAPTELLPPPAPSSAPIPVPSQPLPLPVPSIPPAKAVATTSTTAVATAPKFTRNTPASSAAALDFRFNSSRAILCAAGNLVFEALTPPLTANQQHLDALSVPQNPALKSSTPTLPGGGTTTTNNNKPKFSGIPVNMGAVVVEAQTLSLRTIGVVENAVRRSNLRYEYRRTNAMYSQTDPTFLQLPNPYVVALQSSTGGKDSGSNDSPTPTTITITDGASDLDDDPDGDDDDASIVPHCPNRSSRTSVWMEHCLPRLLNIWQRGAGHVIYHDYHWKSRHGRLAHLLHQIPNNKYGPHLIVTIEPEVVSFAQEFEPGEIRPLIHQPSDRLRALAYHGSLKRRRRLRQTLFNQGKGLEVSPWHILVTSYSALLQDFLHFSQVPFDSIILDDGVLWMSAAHADFHSGLGSVWENIFAKNDQQIGLAGTINTDEHWNFGIDGDIPESIVREGWVGLTCRHRIMTSSSMSLDHARGQERAPVSGLLGFVAPHFADVVREEWDRSRITGDTDSMAHFRSLVARSTVAHFDNSQDTTLLPEEQSLAALNGRLDTRERLDPEIPEMVYDDAFVSDGKINFSRRGALAWLGRIEWSWLRYELGKAKLQHILDAMKISNRHGHICEEITTASSTTSSGATGQVAGTLAFRLAIRCGRHFGSEQGLRQHVSALHAPPGTWLCRTCGSDCTTSQARTHHERSCGAPMAGTANGEPGANVGATPTVGQGNTGKSGVGKKKSGRSSASQPANSTEEKDPDGSLRVPGYRGVWVNPEGKHFVKIDGQRVTKEDSGEPLLFDNIDDAARKYDELVKEDKKGTMELNFKPDGSRVTYEDSTPSTASGLGGSATSVVPALSIINIKDLPPDVKPLLRDPRQTSRTGGNSKRHVYAYRGVCRQARKGHDRWQSQISFMGVNHYLGTFDSEWDAAAIYAWAHLILYGEEATKQAQKEGEEAAAAYEREQQDIAAGKLPEVSPRQKKKKPPAKKPEKGDATGADAKTGADGAASKAAEPAPKKRKSVKEVTGVAPEKKTKTNTKACKLEKEAIGSTVAKGVTKASVIAPKEIFEDMTDDELIRLATTKLKAAKGNEYCVSELRLCLASTEHYFRPCLPWNRAFPPLGGALLLGLNPSLFGWDLQEFVASHNSSPDVIQMLAVEYDDDGVNEKFKSTMQGTISILGRASDVTQQAYKNLGLGSLPVGGSAGKLDCHLGGVPGSCVENAACIRYSPKEGCDFWFSCLSDDSVVTLNGQRIGVSHGSLPLYDEDICSVGARVFVFLTAVDKR